MARPLNEPSLQPTSVIDRLVFAVEYDKRLRKYIRLQADAKGTPYPLEVVDGVDPPRLAGQSFYWTNKSGTKIKYPSAYRKAFGNPIYNASSMCVEVGADWILDVLMMREHLKEP